MMDKARRIIPLCVLLIFVFGCNLANRFLPAKQTPLSKVAPALPAPPARISVRKGTPEEQAVYFADLLKAPNTRLAGWLALYDALGVPVIGQDGAALTNTGDDPIGPRYWNLWYTSGLDQPGRGIPLTDAGRLIAVGTPGVDGATLGPALINDLRAAMKSSDPQVRLLGMFVRERIKRWPSHLDIQDASVTPEQAIIDLPTIHLIMWIVARAQLFQA